MADCGIKCRFFIREKARMCFRRVRKIAKSDYYLLHVCPPGTKPLSMDGFS
jgi:hypothetical protein